MKKIKLLCGLAVIVLASAFAVYDVVDWKVRDDYSVTVYQGGNKFVSFTGLKAVILFDEENPEKSKITATIDAASVSPGEKNDALQNGAKQPEALDVEQYPKISFESKTVTRQDAGYLATGLLTMKGVSKEIQIPFTFENEVFKGGFAIAPKDYNITSVSFQKNLYIVLKVPVSKY